jgi:hypothetical protein
MKRIFQIGLALALVVSMAGCSDFLSGPNLDTDPNRAVDVPVENLLVGMQVNSYGVMGNHCNRTVMMWMQQMAGVAQHYTGYDVYNQTPLEFDAEWFDFYGGGGLQDMRVIQQKALKDGKRTVVAIAKMWEALTMSTVADLWGEVPYSEAINPDIPTPKYDKQSAVHSAILQLIDSAIEDFNAGQSFFDGQFDFTYAGNKAKWIAAANTLKARILLNWAEVDQGKYAQALATAQLGIGKDADNWKTRHSDVAGEEAPWWQFEAFRFGYVRAGKFMVDLLAADNDPRLQVYFAPDRNSKYVGSAPGQYNGDASALNPQTFGAKSWNTDLVSWFENQFIMAECEHAMGKTAEAINRLNNVIQPGLEAKWALAAKSLKRYDAGLTGADALKAIMVEKYKAMFLNMQIWSDWRRTAYPVFTQTTPDKRPIPRRLLYSADELNVNPNTPRFADPLNQRVENDPGNPAHGPGHP